MAPKASKGKATVAEREQALAAERLTRARFRGTIVNEEMVGKLRWLVAGQNNEHGVTCPSSRASSRWDWCRRFRRSSSP